MPERTLIHDTNIIYNRISKLTQEHDFPITMSVLSSILSGDKVRALIFDDHPKYENTNSKERGIFYTFSNTKLSDMCLSSIFGSYSCICSSRLICHIYYSNFAKHQKFKFNFFSWVKMKNKKFE